MAAGAEPAPGRSRRRHLVDLGLQDQRLAVSGATGPHLVLDTCAALHLKQLRALDLLEFLVDGGTRLAMTTAVEVECTACSLLAVLQAWRDRKVFRSHGVRLKERRELLNLVGKVRPMPGRNDVDLVALARRLDAPLLTHDSGVASLASKARLLTLDVVDLAAWLVHRACLDWDRANQLLAGLDGFAWQPEDWLRSARATWAGRSRGGRLLARLERWCP